MKVFQTINDKFLKFKKDEKGQTLVEYALLLVLIAIVVIAAVRGIGTKANTTYEEVGNALVKQP
jgi:pilus assembly protein Flp/PilA